MDTTQYRPATSVDDWLLHVAADDMEDIFAGRKTAAKNREQILTNWN
jgi:hypothetical protein